MDEIAVSPKRDYLGKENGAFLDEKYQRIARLYICTIFIQRWNLRDTEQYNNDCWRLC